MGRKGSGMEPSRWGFMIPLVLGFASFSVVFVFMSNAFRHESADSKLSYARSSEHKGENRESGSGGCCRGIQGLELWGAAVKWGTDFKFNSAEQCCKACKEMCTGKDGPCLCNTWVFCGDKEACMEKFGECWLKKQKDVMLPEKKEESGKTMWTSGLVFGGGEGILGLVTEHGTLRIKLLPHCSPYSVSYILELLTLRHCAGCHFYRAESRGQSWDALGNHIKDAPMGPPFALVQGSLDAQGMEFKEIQPPEHCPAVRRGSVAWVGGGPDFFISLANHDEWRKDYTVFGSVLPEDMSIVEKISRLPTKADVWNNVNVTVLKRPVPLKIQTIKVGHGDLDVSSD